MNWTDDEIDKLFQESASKVDVPYKDTYWNEMEAMLPRKKRKGIIWLWGGGLSFLTFAVAAATVIALSPVEQKPAGTGKATLHSGTSESTQRQTETETGIEKTPESDISVEKQSDVTGNSAAHTANNTIKQTSNTGAGTAPSGITETSTPLFHPVREPEATAVNEVSTDQTILALPMNKLDFAQSDYQLIPLAAFSSMKKKHGRIYVEASAGIVQSPVKSGSAAEWLPTAGIGAGYQYRPQGIGFSGGIALGSSFGNSLEITRRSKVYNFGATNYEQNLRYNQLYHVEMPVSVDFRKNNHVFSIGLTPTYLATTRMRFSQKENEAIVVEGSYWGQRVGMHSFGLKPAVSYQLSVSQSWYLGIRIESQLIPQTDAEQFIGEPARFPLSGQITLRKTLKY